MLHLQYGCVLHLKGTLSVFISVYFINGVRLNHSCFLLSFYTEDLLSVSVAHVPLVDMCFYICGEFACRSVQLAVYFVHSEFLCYLVRLVHIFLAVLVSLAFSVFRRF